MFSPATGQSLIPVNFPELPIPVRSAPPVMDSPEVLQASDDVYGVDGGLKDELAGDNRLNVDRNPAELGRVPICLRLPSSTVAYFFVSFLGFSTIKSTSTTESFSTFILTPFLKCTMYFRANCTSPIVTLLPQTFIETRYTEREVKVVVPGRSRSALPRLSKSFCSCQPSSS